MQTEGWHECGQFIIRLDQKTSPKTAASFASLARSGFDDGEGQAVVDAIGRLGDPASGGGGLPLQPVVIDSAKLVPG
jgi:hypothetical protein